MAFRERLELVVDVVTGNSTSSGLKKLRADLDDADGAFGKVKVAGSAMWESIQANAAQYAMAAGAALAGFAVKAVGDFQETALGAGKLRDSLGVTAEEASRLQEVAGDLGIGVGTLEGAIGRMNRVAGSTPEVFNELGAEIKRNKDGTVNTTETFIGLIGTLNGMKDPAERAAAAQKVLGRSWQDAAELIELGADGVRAAMEDVESAKVIDDKEIEQARKFRDSLDKLKGVGESLSIALGGSLVPALTDVGDALGDLSGPLGTATSKWQEFADTDIGKTILAAISPVDQAKNAFEKAGEAIDVVTGKADDMTVTYDAAASEAAWLAKQQEGVADVTDDLTGSFGGLIPKVEDASASEEELNRRTEALARRHKEAGDRAAAQAEQLRDLAKAQQNAAGDAHNLERAQLALDDALAGLEAQQWENLAVQQDATSSAADQAAAARSLREAELSAADAAWALAQRTAEQAGAADGSAQKTRIMRDALQEQANKYPHLRDEIQAYIDQLNRIPTTKTTNVNTIYRQSGQPNAGVGTNRALAKGGDVAAGEPVIVGDKFGVNSPSAELFVPDQAGTVYPNFSTTSGTPAGGGGGGTYNVAVYMPPGSSIQQVTRSLARKARVNGPAWARRRDAGRWVA